jgi:hypothetical protein
MSLAETHEYLAAHGIRSSPSSVKAWSRSTYNAPRDALGQLWKIVKALNGRTDMPEHVPSSVVNRLAMHDAMREWYPIEFPSDDDSEEGE